MHPYLANHVSRVASRFQVIGHGLELQRQPAVLSCAPERVLHPRVKRIPAAHDGAAARRTNHVPIVAAQFYTLMVQRVQERGLDLRAMKAYVVVALPQRTRGCSRLVVYSGSSQCHLLPTALTLGAPDLTNRHAVSNDIDIDISTNAGAVEQRLLTRSS